VCDLGDPGLAVLARALGNEREAVARSAERILIEQLAQWRSLPASRSSPKVARLVEHLASNVGHYGPRSRAAASDLAANVLVWPVDRRAVDVARLLEQCEVLVRTIPGRAASEPVEQMAIRPRPVQRAKPISPAQLDESLLGGLPGGGLPAHASPMPSLPPGFLAPSGPRVLPGEPPVLTPPVRPEPDIFVPLPSEPEPLLPPEPSPPSVPLLPPPTGGNRSAMPGRMGVRRAWPAALADMPDRDVMPLLVRDDRQLAPAAERELRRRGFSDVELQLAERLADPNPEVRRDLALALPQLAVDTQRWLVWLSEDDDADVRLAAVTVMATSRDPLLHNRLRELRGSETDARIVQQLERWHQMSDRPQAPRR
jgi:hypothetical protein